MRHPRVGALGSDRVRLAEELLGEEVELAPDGSLPGEHRGELVEMAREARELLGDVEAVGEQRELAGEVGLGDLHVAGELLNPGDEVGKHLSAGDLDGDGEVDLVITNSRNDGGLIYGPATPRPVYIVHGPHEGTSSLADADDTIWESETTDYIDFGGVIAGRFTSSAADDLVVHAGGQGAAFHFER